MTGVFLIGLIAIFAAVVLTGAWAVLSTLADPPQDTLGRVETPRKLRGSRSLFRRLKGWLNQTPPKLYYRRDKRGRFRKVWRG